MAEKKPTKAGTPYIMGSVFTGDTPASGLTLSHFMQYVEEVLRPEGAPTFTEWRGEKMQAMQKELEEAAERQDREDRELRKRVLDFIAENFVWRGVDGSTHDMMDPVFPGLSALNVVASDPQGRRVIDNSLRFMRDGRMKKFREYLTEQLEAGSGDSQIVGGNCWWATRYYHEGDHLRCEDREFWVKRKY